MQISFLLSSFFLLFASFLPFFLPSFLIRRTLYRSDQIRSCLLTITMTMTLSVDNGSADNDNGSADNGNGSADNGNGSAD